jgi:hypothetical protein
VIISRRLAVILLLLVPSALLAWSWRSMPQLGFYHDDSLYWVGAQSIAQGHGYRILSLPGEPFQTKYPPLFPAILALVWRLNPSFPANLPAATLLLWCVFPVYLFLIWRLLERLKFNTAEQVALTAISALNPMAVLLTMSMMPELLFTTLLLAVFLVRPPALRGCLGALAYLSKSAALPLLLTMPLCYAIRRQYRQALLFAASMLPAVLLWQAWVQSHVSKSQDLVTLYYTNYLGFQLYNVSWRDLPVVVWYNLDGFLMGIGKLLTFDVAIFESKHLERVVAIAAIAGVVRLARKTGEIEYPVFAGAFSLMLLVWHYQPDQRFVFPLYPLLLAGLWAELKNVGLALQASWIRNRSGDRVAAAAFGSVLALFAIFFVAASAIGMAVFLHRVLQTYRDDLEARRPAYTWLANAASAGAGVFAYDDPLVYLYTGRHACNLPIPTRLYYHDDQAALDRMVDEVPAFAAAHHLDYVLLTPTDFYRDLHEARARRLSLALASDPSARKLYLSPAAAIYSLTPVQATREELPLHK